MAASDNLKERVQSLLQELQDMIRQFTFTERSGLRRVNKSYQLPTYLLVNRATRSNLTTAYYGDGSIFQFDNEDTLRKCFRSISPSHQKLVNNIRLDRRLNRGLPIHYIS